MLIADFGIAGFWNFLRYLSQTKHNITKSQNQKSFQLKNRKFNEVLADKPFVFSEIAMIIFDK
jgi:hypothetical protein